MILKARTSTFRLRHVRAAPFWWASRRLACRLRQRASASKSVLCRTTTAPTTRSSSASRNARSMFPSGPATGAHALGARSADARLCRPLPTMPLPELITILMPHGSVNSNAASIVANESGPSWWPKGSPAATSSSRPIRPISARSAAPIRLAYYAMPPRQANADVGPRTCSPMATRTSTMPISAAPIRTISQPRSQTRRILIAPREPCEIDAERRGNASPTTGENGAALGGDASQRI